VSVEQLLAVERATIEAALKRLIGSPNARPRRLHEAIAYSVFAGGKRIRPILARLACRAAGGDPEQITEAACGLELIHTYSLVHDDLPAMDDDVLRRGRPTVHVAFDEATAILVGDALLAEGMLTLALFPRGDSWGPLRADAVALVAEAVSSRGMVGGQAEDIENTGRISSNRAALEGRLERIHRHKTGCLLQASVELGAILARADGSSRQAFAVFGADLGLAFQVADDILDATASADDIGKSPGKDAQTGKLTYVTLMGLEAAQHRLGELEEKLAATARSLEGPDGELAALARFICRRAS
jgi:geranylgeranyl pyrophosphate synthase